MDNSVGVRKLGQNILALYLRQHYWFRYDKIRIE